MKRRAISIRGETYERLQQFCSRLTERRGTLVRVPDTADRQLSRFLDIAEAAERMGKDADESR